MWIRGLSNEIKKLLPLDIFWRKMPWKLKNENVISMMVKTMRGESGWFPLKSGLLGPWALALLLFAPYLFSYTRTTGLVLILRYSLFSFLFGKLFYLFSYKPNAMTGVRTSESPLMCVSFFVWKSVDVWCDWLIRVVGTWIWLCWQSIHSLHWVAKAHTTLSFCYLVLSLEVDSLVSVCGVCFYVCFFRPLLLFLECMYTQLGCYCGLTRFWHINPPVFCILFYYF